jgi:hypothetical protein
MIKDVQSVENLPSSSTNMFKRVVLTLKQICRTVDVYFYRIPINITCFENYKSLHNFRIHIKANL